MTPANWRQLRYVVLGIAMGLLLMTLAGMLGLIPKLAASRSMIPVAVALVIAAGAMRRRAKQP